MRVSLPQKELNRLLSYAEGLGIVVNLIPVYKKGSAPAQITFHTPAVIDLCIDPYFTKADIILALLHELGHYHDWLNQGRREMASAFFKPDHELTKTDHRVIYRSERNATIMSIAVAQQLDLKYPKTWQIRAGASYDRWFYRYIVKHGKEPSPKERRLKDEQLRTRYKRTE